MLARARGIGRSERIRVPAGDCETAFARAAAGDGLTLEPQSFDWLCEQGHVGLERVANQGAPRALLAS